MLPTLTFSLDDFWNLSTTFWNRCTSIEVWSSNRLSWLPPALGAPPPPPPPCCAAPKLLPQADRTGATAAPPIAAADSLSIFRLVSDDARSAWRVIRLVVIVRNPPLVGCILRTGGHPVQVLDRKFMYENSGASRPPGA